MDSQTFDRLVELVRQELASLGSTRSEIAGNLCRLGVKGKRSNPCFCPISNYLNKNHPDLHDNLYIETQGDRVVLAYYYDQPWSTPTKELIPPHTAEIPLSLAEQEFITLFDNGAYPELDKTREEWENL